MGQTDTKIVFKIWTPTDTILTIPAEHMPSGFQTWEYDDRDMGTKDNPDFDHNSVTDLAPAIKAKITAYRKACEEYAYKGARHPKFHEGIIQTLQETRYDLERTILTHLKKGTKALLDRCRSPPSVPTRVRHSTV